jgi:Domain of unknown function (DUF4166)
MPGGSLYRQALGSAYLRQSRAGQILHDAGPSRWTGRCRVEGGESGAAWLLARSFGLPATAADTTIVVEFAAVEDGELWTRCIGTRLMRSRQYLARGRPPGWIVERFGVFAFDLELQAANGRLELLMRGMRCCGVALPRALWPRIAAAESEQEGRFCFDVQIGLPLVGRLVRYRGWLTDR